MESSNFAALDLIFLALAAVFLILRLRTLLGQRIEKEGQTQNLANPGLAKIEEKIPDFKEEGFLKACRSVFEQVVQAFQASSLVSVKPLLSEDLYQNLIQIMPKEAHSPASITFQEIAIEKTGVTDVTVWIEVKFITQDAQGVEKTDYWTFSRPIRQEDRRWIVIQTRN